jgi:hypothetical protein
VKQRFTWLFLACLLKTSLALAQPPPAIFFSDLISGPNSGGENVDGFSGAYVTLYGNFLGESRGASAVTWNGLNCLRVVSSGESWLWYQKIVVQLGSGCVAGPGKFVVTTVNGISNGVQFSVNSGHIYFVSTSGSDSNNGSFARPWLTLPHAVKTAGVNPGAVIYAMNGVSQTEDDGQSWNASLTMRNDWCKGTSSQPNALVAYPGAVVKIGNSGSTPTFGMRYTQGNVTNGGCAGYWTWAGIRFTGVIAAAIGNGSYSRFVGNDVTNPQSAGIAGGSAALDISALHTSIFGNNCHDLILQTTDRLAQGVYPSTDSNWTEFAWNVIANTKGRAGLQIHSSPTTGSNGLVLHDIFIHDNIIHDTAEEAILVDTVDPSKGPILVYNNVIYAGNRDGFASSSSLYFANDGDFNQSNGIGSGSVQFYNNTIYCQGGEACFRSYFSLNAGQPVLANVRNNLIYSTGGVPYWEPGLATWNPGGYCQSSYTPSQCPNFAGSNNLVFGNGAATFTSILTNNVNVDPLLVNPGTNDFHLQPGSPAVGAGIPITGLSYDIDGRIRPSLPSIGAYEGTGGTRPTPPSHLSAVVY